MKRIGCKMRVLLGVLERLGSELGRPPSSREIQKAVPDMDRGNLSKTLAHLATAGHLDQVGRGHYVLVKTLYGRPVKYTQTVGLMSGLMP